MQFLLKFSLFNYKNSNWKVNRENKVKSLFTPWCVALRDAPKHKHPGSGSYLPQDQKCDAPVLNSPPEVQRTFGFWIDDEKCPFGGDFFPLSASHLNPNPVRCT